MDEICSLYISQPALSVGDVKKILSFLIFAPGLVS